MAQERLGMRSVREVLRLKWVLGRTDTEVAAGVRCARSTVAEMVRRAREAGIDAFPEADALSDAELEARLYPRLAHAGAAAFALPRNRPLPEWSELHAEMKRRGNEKLTLSLLWAEYRAEHPNGYGQTQFFEYYARWKKKLVLSMRQEHRAGEKAFVDYYDGIAITDPVTGERKKTELFVGCLGASSYTFAEASFSQDLPSWLLSHVRIFEFFGGVPAIVVPDNLKSGVTRPERYEPEINPSYQDLVSHYGCCVIPARVRKPKDKCKVEAAVLVAQRWILARLRNRVFHSLSDMNAAIAECLALVNDRKMRGLNKSRHELWLDIDRPALKPLPATRYEFAEWRKARLQINYHVRLDDHFYSAPYAFIHKELWCRSSAEMIEIFHQGARIASHPRSFAQFKYSTDPAHMPPAHRGVAEWTPERITTWAAKIGPAAADVVDRILRSKDHPQQAFNAALGAIRLANQFTPERLEAACRRAIAIGSPSYTTLKTMLKNRMESAEQPSAESSSPAASPRTEQLSLAIGQNVRGKGYYH
jgi:transposase